MAENYMQDAILDVGELLGADLYAVVYDEDEDRLELVALMISGVGPRGFTLSDVEDDPWRMDSTYAWDTLGKDYFLSREKAQAIVDDYNGRTVEKMEAPDAKA